MSELILIRLLVQNKITEERYRYLLNKITKGSDNHDKK